MYRWSSLLIYRYADIILSSTTALTSEMSDTSRLPARRIKDGTVIDHIEAGKALLVLRALSISGKEGNVISVALNVPISKHGKKDIIKVENSFVERSETNRRGLSAPRSTININ